MEEPADAKVIISDPNKGWMLIENVISIKDGKLVYTNKEDTLFSKTLNKDQTIVIL